MVPLKGFIENYEEGKESQPGSTLMSRLSMRFSTRESMSRGMAGDTE